MGKQLDNSLFTMNDYRPYVKQWVAVRGRGEYRRISQVLQIHTTLVSQVFSGRKCLTEEQASKICSYMGLNQLETDYFLKLVQIERAGAEQLKIIYKRHLKQIQSQANEIKSRVPEPKKLSEQDRAIFYSSWQYGVVRLLTSIENFQTAQEISSYLNLPISRVQEILDFLVSRGLCKMQNNIYHRTERNTHVDSQSALAIRHHQNWRAKSLSLHEKMNIDDFVFTAPVSISKKDSPKIRAALLDVISEISKIVEGSPPEDVVYLGIDWIKIVGDPTRN